MPTSLSLDQLVTSFAAALVNAHRYLDQATAQVSRDYDESPILKDVARPRFSLEQVTFDLAYVVDSVNTPTPPTAKLGSAVAFTDAEMAALKKGVDEAGLKEFDGFLKDYDRMRDLLTRYNADPIRGVPMLSRLTPTANVSLQPLTLEALRKGARESAKQKLEDLLKDYEASRLELARVREAAVAAPSPQVAVRVDPAAWKDVPESARQRVQLTFRAEPTAAVRLPDGSTPS